MSNYLIKDVKYKNLPIIPNNFSDSSTKRKRKRANFYRNQKKTEVEISRRMSAITQSIVNEDSDSGMSHTTDSKYYLSSKSNIVQLHSSLLTKHL